MEWIEIINESKFDEIVDSHLKFLSDGSASIRGNVSNSVVLFDNYFRLSHDRYDLRRFVFTNAMIEMNPVFYDSNFSDANFNNCRMRGAAFFDCDFSNAKFGYADLSGSTFTRCDFSGADMSGVNLVFVDFHDCKNMPYFPMVCPETGSFVAYKIAYAINFVPTVPVPHPDVAVVKLEIPEDAKRSSATGRKCRASKAKVLSIESVDGKHLLTSARSSWDPAFIYETGETYEIKYFDENRFNECSTGIHFFLGRNEALRYAGIARGIYG